MRALRGWRLADLGLAAGHAGVLAGAAQPWVYGQFGARHQLTGLDLARVTHEAMRQGLAEDAFAFTIVRLALLGLLLASANALVLLSAAGIGLTSRRLARRGAALCALPVALIALAALAIVIIGARADGFVAGPAAGLLFVNLSAALALVSAAFRAAPRTAEGRSRSASPA